MVIEEMKVEDTEQALTEAVCSRVREQLGSVDADLAEAFARQLYRWVAAEDVAERDPLDLYGLALGHFNFARERAPGTPKVRVYNPRFEDHGWQSTHTAVEIVTDDMPFLIDSVSMELNRRGFGVHLIIHPVLGVRRGDDGELLEILPQPPTDKPEPGVLAESVIHAEVARQTDPEKLHELELHLERVIAEVRAAVEDWAAMRSQALDVAADLRSAPLPASGEDVEETVAFLEWLEAHNFTFLGYREYDADGPQGPGLGILRGPLEGEDAGPSPAPRLLTLTKANSRATVHRPSYLDYVGVKRFDADGNVIGERRFLGLYTHTAYRASPTEIPILRRRIATVLERAGFPHGSHNEKALLEILDTYPRDELFQISTDELFDVAMGILHLGERQRLRLFARRDPFGRFFSMLVFVPRDRFNTENRRRIEAILRNATSAASIDYTTRVSESVLVRLHFVAYVEPGLMPDFDAREVEMMLVAATRSWADDLEEALVEDLGEEHGGELFRRYADAFPAAYRADWVARSALADIVHIEELPKHEGLGISLYRPLEAGPRMLRAKLFRAGRALTLSDVLPLFENMGVEVADERPYPIVPRGADGVWIYDFGLTYSGSGRPRCRRCARQLPGRVRARLARRGRERRLQPPGARRRAHLARDHRAAGDRQVPAPGAHHVQRSLRGAGAGGATGDRAIDGRAVPGALRPAAHRSRGRRGGGGPDREGDRRGGEPRTGPDPAHVPGRDPRHAAHELLPHGPERARAAPVVQARPVGAALAAAAPPPLRDLRLLPAHGGSAPARRAGRPRRHPVVGPARGLPHRGARADEGPDGEERGDRARGREGRVRGEAAARAGATICPRRSWPATRPSSAGCST